MSLKIYYLKKHKNVYEILLGIWLLFIPVLEIIHSSLGYIIFMSLFSLLIGYILGSSDIIDVSEEFIVSLPEYRKNIFIIKFLLGFIPILMFSLFGVVLLVFNIPQKFWSIFVETGFTEPFCKLKLLDCIECIGFPLSFYLITFSVSKMPKKPSTASFGWLYSLIICVLILWIGILIEQKTLNIKENGIFAMVLAGITGLMLLLFSLEYFKMKDINIKESYEGVLEFSVFKFIIVIVAIILIIILLVNNFVIL